MLSTSLGPSVTMYQPGPCLTGVRSKAIVFQTSTSATRADAVFPSFVKASSHLSIQQLATSQQQQHTSVLAALASSAAVASSYRYYVRASPRRRGVRRKVAAEQEASQDDAMWSLAGYETMGSRQALHLAAESGFLSVCKEYLSTLDNEKVNSTDGLGRTALHLAAQEGHADVCAALMASEKFSAVNRADMYGRTALHLAAAGGHPEICQAILQNDVFTEVFAKDMHDQTALTLAAAEGKEAVSKLIIAKTCSGGMETRAWQAAAPQGPVVERRGSAYPIETPNALGSLPACHNCGAVCGPSWKVCAFCKAPLNIASCPHCGATVGLNWKMCRRCKGPLE